MLNGNKTVQVHCVEGDMLMYLYQQNVFIKFLMQLHIAIDNKLLVGIVVASVMA